jgi:tRNA(fMet)-specific endonuclease VapC
MSLFVFDTDIFTHYRHGLPVVVRRIVQHAVGHRLALPVPVVDELISGWQASFRRARVTPAQLAYFQSQFAEVVELMAGFEILPMTAGSLARHAALMAAKLQVKSPDLRIAAVALEASGIVVTRNLRDFRRVPGLICEDWSV